MSKEELLNVFKWLEETINQSNLLYFKLESDNHIGAYFNNNNQHLADFYINN